MNVWTDLRVLYRERLDAHRSSPGTGSRLERAGDLQVHGALDTLNFPTGCDLL